MYVYIFVLLYTLTQYVSYYLAIHDMTPLNKINYMCNFKFDYYYFMQLCHDPNP